MQDIWIKKFTDDYQVNRRDSVVDEVDKLKKAIDSLKNFNCHLYGDEFSEKWSASCKILSNEIDTVDRYKDHYETLKLQPKFQASKKKQIIHFNFDDLIYRGNPFKSAQIELKDNNKRRKLNKGDTAIKKGENKKSKKRVVVIDEDD